MDSVDDFIRRWRQLGQLTRSGERAELFQYLRVLAGGVPLMLSGSSNGTVSM
jgi:hypothetical protein